MKILIVEDAVALANSVAKYLIGKGFAVDVVYDGNQALEKISQTNYDLILLDINIPHLSGFEVGERLKKYEKNIPVIATTARDSIDDKLKGFEIGFVDYVTKPFDLRELEARINLAIHKSASGSLYEALTLGRFTINPNSRIFQIRNDNIPVTKLEFDLLLLLMNASPNVVTNSDIIDTLWGDDADIIDPPVRTHIKNVRKKIRDEEYTIIQTVPGVGYKFVA